MKIVDVPGGRKNHPISVPRGGGILIFICLTFSILLFVPSQEKTILLLSSSLVLICGLKDDISSVPWYKKLFVQFLAALIFIYKLYPLISKGIFFNILIPFPIDIILLSFFIVGSTNAVNMLDGLDGLASGLVLEILSLIFMLAFITSNLTLLFISAAVAGGLLGFLRFNAHPASIFLGDCGSLLIGFLTAVSTILLSMSIRSGNIDFMLMLLILGLPIVDALKVITIRLFKGQNIFLPDRCHIHHQIPENIIHHKHNVAIIQLFNLVFCSAALLYVNNYLTVSFILFCLVTALLLFFRRFYIYLLRFQGRMAILFENLCSGVLGLKTYKKILVPLCDAAILLTVLSILPSNTGRSTVHDVVSTLSGLLLIGGLYLKAGRSWFLPGNLFLFLITASLIDRNLISIRIGIVDTRMLSLAAASFLLFVSGFFIAFRQKITGKRIQAFTGLELILVVFFAAVFLMYKGIGIKGPSIELYFFTGLTIYLWYKMRLIVEPRLEKKLLIGSYMLPASLILIFIF